MANKLPVLDEGQKGLNEMIRLLKEVQAEIVKTSQLMRQTPKNTFDLKTPRQANKILQERAQISDQMSAALKEQDRLERALISQIEKNKIATESTNRALIKQRIETAQLNKAIKEETILNSRLSSEYQKLVVKMNQAGRVVQNLTAKKEQGIRLTKREQKELRRSERDFKKYNRAVIKADASINRFQRNVGNYSSAFGKAGLALRNFAGAFGVLSAAAIARDVFTLVKEIDGLDKALKQVTETQTAYNRAQRFTTNLAEEAGVKINGLQKSYVKFLASAKTTNLTVSETENIFKQTAKAGAILGLSTDDINGSFRALEQILSKGKVQAEEIRGQLGERLPGAFQILAKSMGLTTAELSKQLELGNVISEEVLPNFAKELEKTYGLDKVSKVETLTAAQNRLGNSWTAFIRGVSENGGILTRFLTSSIELTNDLLKAFDRLTSADSFGDFIKRLGRAFTIGGDAISDAEKKGKEAQEERLELQLKLLKTVELNRKLGKLGDEEYLNRKREIFKMSLEELRLEDEKADRLVKNNIKVKEIQTKAKQELEGTIAFYEKYIAQLKKEQSTLATSSEQYEAYAEAISRAQIAIDSIKGIDDGVLEAFESMLSEMDAEGLGEEISQQLSDGINSGLENLSNVTGIGLEELFKEFNSLYEWDYQNFLKFSKKKIEQSELEEDKKREALVETLENTAKLTNALGDIANALFDRKIQQYDDDIQKNNDYYAVLLDNENLSEEQRSQLEAERERKNAELEKKKRDEQRKQAQVNKATAIFDTIISTAAGVAKALPNIPLAVLTGVLGAAQLATIIAQPIPKYKHGRKGGDAEFAYVGDGGVNEIIARAGGGYEITPNKETLTYLNKGDSVLPDANKFLQEQAYKLSLTAQGRTIERIQVSDGLTKKDIDRQTQDLVKALSENKTSVRIHNNNSIASDLNFINRLNDVL